MQKVCLAGISPSKLRRLRRRFKKPNFTNLAAAKFKRVRDRWKRPRGLDNPHRKALSGRPALVKVGYRTMKAIRGLHPSGRIPLIVHNVSELEKVKDNLDKYIVIIGRAVGFKKKLEIYEKAEKMGALVANPPKEVAEVGE
uniref:Large ribosomal subunit protein eL32 n=1 Tax=uncultured korarchaeote TaxID=161241 RepID=A0A1L2JJZ6_9CREN|nr:ribosomal protein L32E [uncultured korarchaeote]